MNNEWEPISFLATSDANRSKEFYCDILGLGLVEDSPFALVFEDHGTMLRVQKVQEISPATHTVHGWKVPDIEGAIERLVSLGVEFTLFERLDQSASGVWTSPTATRWPGSRIPAATTFH